MIIHIQFGSNQNQFLKIISPQGFLLKLSPAVATILDFWLPKKLTIFYRVIYGIFLPFNSYITHVVSEKIFLFNLSQSKSMIDLALGSHLEFSNETKSYICWRLPKVHFLKVLFRFVQWILRKGLNRHRQQH